VMRLDSVVRPAINPDSVQFYLNEPRRPYQAIGLVDVSGEGRGLNLETLKKRLGLKARKLGAEGVILGRESKQGSTVFVPVGATIVASSVDEKERVGKLIVFLSR
jgi:hypothetical protein